MILAVCPNLAVDSTLEVESLSLGDVHRAERTRHQAGGKGANLARALRSLGERVVLLGFAGGRTGELIARGLSSEGVESQLVAIEAESRVCTIVVERRGRATVVNEMGPELSDTGPIRELSERFEAELPRANAVALMGSLPPGVPPDVYAGMTARARAAGKFCLVDAAGEALHLALAERPSIVKPNISEVEELLARRVETERECLDAVDELRSRGADVALVTRGPAGVVVSSPDGIARCANANDADIRLGNPTGAGDALAAGILAGHVRGFPFPEMVRLGVAAATASLAEGYGRIRSKDVRVEAVSFERY